MMMGVRESLVWCDKDEGSDNAVPCSVTIRQATSKDLLFKEILETQVKYSDDI